MTRVCELMTQDVVTVTPTMTIDTVSALLRKKMISGAPVVDGEGNLVGVISGTDLHEPHPRNTPIEQLMSTIVLEVEEDADIRQVIDLMRNFRIHRVLVTREKKVVGVVSCLDLLDLLREKLG